MTLFLFKHFPSVGYCLLNCLHTCENHSAKERILCKFFIKMLKYFPIICSLLLISQKSHTEKMEQQMVCMAKFNNTLKERSQFHIHILFFCFISAVIFLIGGEEEEEGQSIFCLNMLLTHSLIDISDSLTRAKRHTGSCHKSNKIPSLLSSALSVLTDKNFPRLQMCEILESLCQFHLKIPGTEPEILYTEPQSFSQWPGSLMVHIESILYIYFESLSVNTT